MMNGSALALCSAHAIVHVGGTAPAWLHLLPAGEIRSRDGRGPYRVNDPAKLAATSLAEAGGKMILCDNHATDLAAPLGQPAPARGWITELQARTDGIWGRVDWTPEGRRLVETRAYRAVSPVISHRKDGTIIGLLRASLVNQPNLVGLTSLHASGARKMDAIDEAIAVYLGLDPEKYQELLNGSANFRFLIEPMRVDFAERGVRLVPEEDDRLSAADHSVIARMGLDPVAYRRQLAVENLETSLHTQENIMSLRSKIIQILELPSYASDEDIIGAAKKLKNGGETSLHSAKSLSLMATEYQQRMEKLGEKIDFATAVFAVQSGNTV